MQGKSGGGDRKVEAVREVGMRSHVNFKLSVKITLLSGLYTFREIGNPLPNFCQFRMAANGPLGFCTILAYL